MGSTHFTARRNNRIGIMKVSTLVLFSTLLFTPFATQFTSAAESDSKSKSKSDAGAETKKAAPDKGKTKSDEKAKETTKKADPKADEVAELKKAESFLKDLPTSKKTSFKKLLNSGDKSELTQLPGIGDATADAIIAARPFESAARLILVKGVGEKTFEDVVKSLK